MVFCFSFFHAFYKDKIVHLLNGRGKKISIFFPLALFISHIEERKEHPHPLKKDSSEGYLSGVRACPSCSDMGIGARFLGWMTKWMFKEKLIR